MERATIQVEGKQVTLPPGMAVTVEVKTGQHQVMEYLLSSVLNGLKDCARER